MTIQDDPHENTSQTLRTYFSATNRAATFAGMAPEQRKEILAAIGRDERSTLMWSLIGHIRQMFGLPVHSVIQEEAQTDEVTSAELKGLRHWAVRSARARIAPQTHTHSRTSGA